MSTQCTSMTLAGVQCSKMCNGSTKCHLHTSSETVDAKKKTAKKTTAKKTSSTKKAPAKKATKKPTKK